MQSNSWVSITILYSFLDRRATPCRLPPSPLSYIRIHTPTHMVHVLFCVHPLQHPFAPERHSWQQSAPFTTTGARSECPTPSCVLVCFVRTHAHPRVRVAACPPHPTPHPSQEAGWWLAPPPSPPAARGGRMMRRMRTRRGTPTPLRPRWVRGWVEDFDLS